MPKHSVPKIDLLMTILKKLDAGEALTAAVLAQDLAVTERSVYRYLETLQMAGYPIYFDRRRSSYSFVDSYKLKQIGNSRDISSALELRKQMLRSSSLGIATYKIDGSCVLINSALARMLNATKEQLLTRNFNEIDLWHKSGLLEMAGEAIAKNEERSADIQLKDIWVNCVVTPFCSNNDNFILVLAHDISSRKHSELAMASFVASIDKGPSLIVITDCEGIVEYVSDKIALITGYFSEEVLGRKTNIFKSGLTPDRVYRNMWETISKGMEWTGELCNRRKSGSTYWEHIRITPIFDACNEIKRYVAVKEDVTQYRQLEDELYRLATCDGLSGLYNRRMVLELANREFDISRRYRDSMAVILVDIYLLKQINSEFGHAAGDAVITRLSQACRKAVRKSDILGRIGDDEFAMVQTGITAVQTQATAERLLRSIEDHDVTHDGLRVPYTVSIGVVLLSDCSEDRVHFAALLDAAQHAAAVSMRKGESRVCFQMMSTETEPDNAH